MFSCSFILYLLFACWATLPNLSLPYNKQISFSPSQTTKPIPWMVRNYILYIKLYFIDGFSSHVFLLYVAGCCRRTRKSVHKENSWFFSSYTFLHSHKQWDFVKDFFGIVVVVSRLVRVNRNKNGKAINRK